MPSSGSLHEKKVYSPQRTNGLYLQTFNQHKTKETYRNAKEWRSDGPSDHLSFLLSGWKVKASATYRRAMVGWTDHNVACSIACYSSHITTLFLHQLQFLYLSAACSQEVYNAQLITSILKKITFLRKGSISITFDRQMDQPTEEQTDISVHREDTLPIRN